MSLPFGKRDEVIALLPNVLMRLRKRRRAEVDAAFESDGHSKLGAIKGVRVLQTWPVESLARISVERTTLMNQVGIRFDTGKKRVRIQVLERESPNLLRALQLLAPGRVRTGCRIGYQLGVIGTILLLVLSLSIPLMLIGYVLAIPLLLIFVMMVAFQVMRHTPKPHWRIETRPKATVDLSQRRPFRSRTLSIVFKVFAVGLLIVYALKLQTYVANELAWYAHTVLFLVFAGIVQIANSLWERDPAKLRASRSKRPVLYLRSFLDDRVTTLNPGTWMSWFLGLDPPLYSIETYRDTPVYPLFRTSILYLSNFHPLRLFKLLFDLQRDTSEEQMAVFFKHYGSFVAIGKPGERFATTGAARMYVGNGEWQATVQELLQESQIVLLQPASTEGIWWEVEHSIRSVHPERLVLAMVNYRDHQNDYETFRLRLEKFLPPGAHIPRGIGCKNYITFFRFENDWTPVELSLAHYSRFLWLFKNQAVNLQRTLKPFLHAAGVVDEKGRALPPLITQPQRRLAVNTTHPAARFRCALKKVIVFAHASHAAAAS